MPFRTKSGTTMDNSLTSGSHGSLSRSSLTSGELHHSFTYTPVCCSYMYKVSLWATQLTLGAVWVRVLGLCVCGAVWFTVLDLFVCVWVCVWTAWLFWHCWICGSLWVIPAASQQWEHEKNTKMIFPKWLQFRGYGMKTSQYTQLFIQLHVDGLALHQKTSLTDFSKTVSCES